MKNLPNAATGRCTVPRDAVTLSPVAAHAAKVPAVCTRRIAEGVLFFKRGG